MCSENFEATLIYFWTRLDFWQFFTKVKRFFHKELAPQKQGIQTITCCIWFRKIEIFARAWVISDRLFGVKIPRKIWIYFHQRFVDLYCHNGKVLLTYRNIINVSKYLHIWSILNIVSILEWLTWNEFYRFCLLKFYQQTSILEEWKETDSYYSYTKYCRLQNYKHRIVW